MAKAAKETGKGDDAPIIIKKYANRRLYNTDSSSYVTLDDLATLVREGRDFVVRDAKTGEDITRSVLTQIIFEQESRGATILPVSFLRQLIGFYGDRLETMLPGYLEAAMDAFTRNQEQIRKMVESSLDPSQTLRYFEAAAQQNLAMFQRAMEMFNPFARHESGAGPSAAAAPADDKIDALERQLAEMQRQLDALRRK
ncbi:MAG: polyhydroxyalkanoate synthesis repressor PhaR [Alphaproteobacteria bacterium]|nr:MAG: polyhydroxyalkanoate synthesis repressor PhaR [Alphaproteobacteria bacterium]